MAFKMTILSVPTDFTDFSSRTPSTPSLLPRHSCFVHPPPAAVDPAREVGVPPAAPELPVGDGLHPKPLLARDRGTDMPVLDPAQHLVGRFPALHLRAHFLDLGRPQQAAD